MKIRNIFVIMLTMALLASASAQYNESNSTNYTNITNSTNITGNATEVMTATPNATVTTTSNATENATSNATEIPTTNATEVPNLTAIPLTNATPNETSTVTSTGTSNETKKFRLAPTISLTSTKTVVDSTSPALLVLSIVNPIVNDVNVEVQPILKVSSGVDITGSSFAESGANQFTGHFIVKPGDSSHINIQVTSSEIGPKSIESQIIYFPEGDKENYQTLQQTLTIDVQAKTTPPPTETVVPTPVPTRNIPGFDLATAIIGFVILLYMRKKI